MNNSFLGIFLILSGIFILIFFSFFPENKSCSVETISSSLITGGIGVLINLEKM